MFSKKEKLWIGNLYDMNYADWKSNKQINDIKTCKSIINKMNSETLANPKKDSSSNEH